MAKRRKKAHIQKNIDRIIMAMPRPNPQATRIAFSIIGTPANMIKSKKKPTKIDQRIAYENSSKMR
jgi:hypothetical protein